MYKSARRVSEVLIKNLFQFRSWANKSVAAENGKNKKIKIELRETATKLRILVEKDTNITLIGINREHSRNSVDTSTADELGEALRQFESDEESPVAVLYGVGGSFCTGHDLAELENQVAHSNLEFLLRREGSVGPTRLSSNFHKPIVCGINGYCVANGLELALMCDLRVMEDTAILGFFNRRLGVPLSDGGTVRLAAAVGMSRALDLLCTGRRVSASEALNVGLINRLVATGTALGQAVNLAFSVAKFPLASLQHDRKALFKGRVYGKKTRFKDCVQNEISIITPQVMHEMQDGIQRFKNFNQMETMADPAGAVKEKCIPNWEKEEIDLEKKYLQSKLSHNVVHKNK